MTDPEAAEPTPEVVTIGETLVMLTPGRATPLAQAKTLSVYVGGAESNVATYLAELGHHARWYSRVGDDPFGTIILRELTRAGVDTSAAVTVPGGRTGVYFKDPQPGGTAVHYFREQAAARGLAPDVLLDKRLSKSRILHLSGITPALSDSARRMVMAGVSRRTDSARLVSFDVNYRPALWPVNEAAQVLRDIAQRSDIAFVGLDEAHLLWGCKTAADVRAVLPGVPTIVVKDGEVGAYSLSAAGTVFVPSPAVDVVEPVGAGDAFAAGYLCGVLEYRAEEYRLRLGHLIAAAALTVTSDHARLPPREATDYWCALPDGEWATLDLRNGRVGYTDAAGRPAVPRGLAND